MTEKDLLPALFWPSVHTLLTDGSSAPRGAVGAPSLVEQCSWHGLLPLMFAATDLPPGLAQVRDMATGWRRIYEVRARLFQEAIVSLCAALGEEPVVFIKGADYGHRLYRDRFLRPMQDIDILVPAHRVDATCKRLRSAGLTPQPAVGAARDPLHHERVLFHGKILVEVHQAFIQNVRHRIDYDAIWQRRVPMEIDGHRVYRLDEVDALAYQALTMAIDQFHLRLIRFVDLWRLLHQRPRIAQAAAVRAREWQAARALYGALSLACRLFPSFRSDDTQAAMAFAVTGLTRRFIDAWVLPGSRELRSISLPSRSLQLWRKACLIDTPARRAKFAFDHARASLRGRSAV